MIEKPGVDVIPTLNDSFLKNGQFKSIKGVDFLEDVTPEKLRNVSCFFNNTMDIKLAKEVSSVVAEKLQEYFM